MQLPPQIQYADLYTRLQQRVLENKHDLGPRASGGDACCAPTEAPEERVKDDMPKLNETLLEILSEDQSLATGEHCGDNNAYFAVKTDALVESMARFTQKCLGTGSLPRREVVLEGCVKGVAETSRFRQGDLLTIKVQVIRNQAVKVTKCDYTRKQWLVLSNSLTRDTYFQEFCLDEQPSKSFEF